MNLGLYTGSLAISEETGYAIENINEGIESGQLTDASIFFDDVGPNHLPIKCGCFNSADIWNFIGSLVVTSVEGVTSALSMVNKFNLIYYHGWREEEGTLGIIGVVNSPRVKTICRTRKDADNLHRITGSKIDGVVENFNISDLLEAIK